MRKDRFTAGILSGLAGAVIQNIYGQIVKGLNISDRTFSDFAEMVLFHQTHREIWGLIAGVTGHLVFGSMMGILLVFFLKKTSSTYLYLKGMAMGTAIWFFSLAIGTLYNIPLFKDIPPRPALTTLVGALIWGLATAFTLNLLEKKTELL